MLYNVIGKLKYQVYIADYNIPLIYFLNKMHLIQMHMPLSLYFNVYLSIEMLSKADECLLMALNQASCNSSFELGHHWLNIYSKHLVEQ